MPRAVGILAQKILTAAVRTDVYTVPSGEQHTISTVFIVNQSSSTAIVEVTACALGAAHDAKQIFIPAVNVPAKDAYHGTWGITLGPTDVLRALTTSANISVTLFGEKVT